MKNKDWKKVKLGEVCEITATSVDPKETPFSNYLHIGGANIESETGNLVDLQTAEEEGISSNKFLFSSQHILYSRIRPYLNKVAQPSFEGICSSDIYPIKVKETKTLKNFLVYVLKSKSFLGYADKHTTGTNIPRLGRKSLLDFPILLPSLPEQKAIAAQLDRADKLRQDLAQSLADYDRLLAASFLDMFGDPVLNPKGWELVKLGELIKKVKKISSDYSSDTIEYVDISSIDNTRQIVSSVSIFDIGERPSRAQQILKKGDILFSTVRPNLRNIALSPRDNLIGSTGFFISRVKSDRIKNQYLFSLLKSTSVTTYFVNQTTGANYPALKSSDLKNLDIPLPPLPLQQQFAQLVERIERQKALIQSAQQSAEDLFGALLQAYFYEGK